MVERTMIIRVKEMAEERGIDEEEAYEFLNLFLDYTQNEDLPALCEALKAEDCPLARKRAHSIKGAALNLKLDEIACVAESLEHKCRAADLQGTGELLEALSECLANLGDVLKRAP